VEREAAGLARPATKRDLVSVRDLLVAADLPVDGLADGFGEAYAVIEAGGRVVGAAGVEVHGDFGLLRSVVVDPAYRGRGFGEVLTSDRLGWARRRRLKAVHLLTTTAPVFFERFGFQRVARDAAPASILESVEFATACPSTAVAMALGLESETRP
jgi:amino-acid N-acetyltransferase